MDLRRVMVDLTLVKPYCSSTMTLKNKGLSTAIVQYQRLKNLSNAMSDW